MLNQGDGVTVSRKNDSKCIIRETGVICPIVWGNCFLLLPGCLILVAVCTYSTLQKIFVIFTNSLVDIIKIKFSIQLNES